LPTLAIGVAMVYSATHNSAGLEGSTIRQIGSIGAGLVLLFVATTVDYRLLSNLQPLIYAVMLIMLGAVLVLGHTNYGAQRWIRIGSYLFQPSEPAKLLLILFLAQYLAGREEKVKQFRTVLVSLVATLIPAALVYKQPDLGTAVILVAIWAAMVLMAGVKVRHVLIIALIAVALSPVLWFLMHDYMRDRVMAFINPMNDLQGAGYDANQAMIAIGSGGWLGKGFGSGTQSQLHFLRVRHTDYIFSVLAEELGLVGGLLLLLLLGIILWRILRAADQAGDAHGRLIASGTAALIFFQSGINLAMNMSLIPSTGVPLPFISYSNNSLLVLLLAIGLVQSVALRRKKLEFG
jgi:rod shape determining protein RodA